MAPQRTVYIIRSVNDAQRFYTGLTSDFATRLKAHNDGCASSTAPYRPWRLVVAIDFADESHAVAFEKYLKT